MMDRGLYDHRGRLIQLRGRALEWWRRLREQGETTAVSSRDAGLWIGNQVVPVLLMGTELTTGGRAQIPVAVDNELPVVNAVDDDGKIIPVQVVQAEPPLTDRVVVLIIALDVGGTAGASPIVSFPILRSTLPTEGDHLDIDCDIIFHRYYTNTPPDPDEPILNQGLRTRPEGVMIHRGTGTAPDSLIAAAASKQHGMYSLGILETQPEQRVDFYPASHVLKMETMRYIPRTALGTGNLNFRTFWYVNRFVGGNNTAWYARIVIRSY